MGTPQVQTCRKSGYSTSLIYAVDAVATVLRWSDNALTPFDDSHRQAKQPRSKKAVWQWMPEKAAKPSPSCIYATICVQFRAEYAQIGQGMD